MHPVYFAITNKQLPLLNPLLVDGLVLLGKEGDKVIEITGGSEIVRQVDGIHEAAHLCFYGSCLRYTSLPLTSAHTLAEQSKPN